MKMITVYSNGKTFDNGAIDEIIINKDGNVISYGRSILNNSDDAEAVAEALTLALPRVFGDVAQGVTGASMEVLKALSIELLGDLGARININTEEVEVTEVIILVTELESREFDINQFLSAGWQVNIAPINANSESPYTSKLTLINPIQPAFMDSDE